MSNPFDGWKNPPAPQSKTAPLPNAMPSNAIPTPNAPNSASDAALLAVSVRLRVEDAGGHSCGSGTIIDARNGKALILTCGHIFRDSQGKGKIDVDVFTPGGLQRAQGQLVSYSVPDLNGQEGNAKADIGLVAISVNGPVATAPVAPLGFRLGQGMAVASVGCNGGDIPSVRRSQVTSLNKFVGAPNVQVAGQPVEGRSGGGLFSAEGYVVGVCNAADPSDKEGLFAALDSIYAELDRAELAFIYKTSSGSPATSPEVAPTSAIAATTAPPAPILAMNAASGLAPITPPAAAMPPSPIAMPAPDQAALDEIHRRQKEGSEVVIIIRPRDNSNAKSEVFMLDRASSEFRRQIANEAKPQEKVYQETSMELAKPRKVLLEWSIDGQATAPTNRAEASSRP
jgi:hypothetical protein